MFVNEDTARYGFLDLPHQKGRVFFSPNYDSVSSLFVVNVSADFIREHTENLDFTPGHSKRDPKNHILRCLTSSPFNRVATPMASFKEKRLEFSDGLNRVVSLLELGAQRIPITVKWDCAEKLDIGVWPPIFPVAERYYVKLQYVARFYTLRASALFLQPWDVWDTIVTDPNPSLEEMTAAFLEMRELLRMELMCLYRKPQIYAHYKMTVPEKQMRRDIDAIANCQRHLPVLERLLPMLMQLHLSGERLTIEEVVQMAKEEIPMIAYTAS